jgi:protein-S-isoprenylcysteine O-methyltransferase Ste14
MHIKGLDQLHKHLPDLNTPLGVLGFFLPSLILFTLIDVLFTTMLAQRLTWPFEQLIAEIVLGGLGFGLLYLFFRYKNDFRNRFGPLAYSRAASRFGFPAVTVIGSVIAHIRYLPGPAIPHFWGYSVLPALGWALIGVSTLLGLRTVQIFGVDNLTMLYVYFPEESQLVNHKIYNILRHPAYSAVEGITFGLALLNGSWFALACALLFSCGLWGWVHLVEENELIRRFGAAYVEYRKGVPAFWPYLRELKGFFAFLIVGR